MQKYDLPKKSSKRNQNPSRYYNCITNLKFQHNPKYHLSKNPHIKIDLLSRGQNPLSYYILYNESKHNLFPCLGRQGQQNVIVQTVKGRFSFLKTEPTEDTNLVPSFFPLCTVFISTLDFCSQFWQNWGPVPIVWRPKCVCVCYDVSLCFFMYNEVVKATCLLFDLKLEIKYNLWIQLNWKRHFILTFNH
jgi:hypothetical protein